MEMFRLVAEKQPRAVLRTKRWRAHWFSIWVLILSSGVSACVSQGKYETVVVENKALKQEIFALKNQPAEIPKHERVPPQPTLEKPMNNIELKRLLANLVGHIGGEEGAWNIAYNDVPMVVLTSPTHDRMRIVSPIRENSTMESSQMKELLKANFDRALDARYAFFRGNLWSVYLHPLGSLSEAELVSALGQVANLVKNYGGTYSSSHLHFQN